MKRAPRCSSLLVLRMLVVLTAFVALVFVDNLHPNEVSAQEQAPPPLTGAVVQSETLVFTAQEGRFRVLNLVTIGNFGQETLEAVVLPLVAGASEVQVDETGAGGEKLVRSGNVLVDTQSLAPGEERSYSYHYLLPAQRLPYRFVRPVLYPTGLLRILSDTTMQIRMEDRQGVQASLIDQGEQEVQGIVLREQVRMGVSPQNDWTLLLSDQGSNWIPHQWQQSILYSAVALVFLCIGALLGAVWTRRRSRRTSGAHHRAVTHVSETIPQDQLGTDSDSVESSKSLEERMIDRMAELDLAYQEGRLTKEAWERERTPLMDELLRLKDGELDG